MKTGQTGNKKWQLERYLNLSGDSGRLSVLKMYQLKDRTMPPKSLPVPTLIFNLIFPVVYAPVVTGAKVSLLSPQPLRVTEQSQQYEFACGVQFFSTKIFKLRKTE